MSMTLSTLTFFRLLASLLGGLRREIRRDLRGRILLTEGLEARTHSGVATLLNLHFVRAGRLPSSAPRALTQLQGEREAADYDASAIYSQEDVEDIFARALESCQTCRTLLAQDGWLD